MPISARPRRQPDIFLFLGALLVVAGGFSAANGQVIERTYVPSAENFANPERGFYRHYEVQAEGTPLSADDIRRLRTDSGISLILRLYYLKTFRDRPLSSRQLDLIRTDFERLREAGMKAILRFAYSQSQSQPDAPLAIVEGHIDQLAPILAANSDVIAVVQAGFIGAWGEWYYSSNGLNNTAARRAVTNALLDALPDGRMVQVRTPDYKRLIFERVTPLTAEEAFGNSDYARTGHHNDCFLASSTDYGTYLNIVTDKAFLEADTRYTPMGGETCVVNPPRSECAVALEELSRFHWSYLNRDYNGRVLSSWASGGCLDEVRLALGYRFALVEGRFSERVRPGGSVSFRLGIANEGFAAPFNGRRAEAILRNQSSGARYAAALPTDPRLWAPGDTTRFEMALGLPDDLPAGSYDLLLNLPGPEPSLRDRPEFAVRMANEGVWEEDTGYNDLQAAIIVDPEASGEAYQGNHWFHPYEAFVGTEDVGASTGSVDVEVFPNPFRRQAHVRVHSGSGDQIEGGLYDMLGRRVYALPSRRVRPGLMTSLPIDVDDLPAGSYVLEVHGERWRTSHLVVVLP